MYKDWAVLMRVDAYDNGDGGTDYGPDCVAGVWTTEAGAVKAAQELKQRNPYFQVQVFALHGEMRVDGTIKVADK